HAHRSRCTWQRGRTGLGDAPPECGAPSRSDRARGGGSASDAVRTPRANPDELSVRPRGVDARVQPRARARAPPPVPEVLPLPAGLRLLAGEPRLLAGELRWLLRARS